MDPKALSPTCDPLVTVVALCYNQRRFLRKTLDSILAQTWPPAHFYIIDDASTDDSVALIKEWLAEKGHPATLIVHEQNQGITKTMNHALSLCQTKYFHPWPCDDLLLPHKIAEQVAFMEGLDWQPGFLYGDIAWIDNDDNMLRPSVIEGRRRLFPDHKMPSGFIFPDLVKHGCFIPTASGLYVTEALKEQGGFDENLFAEDWDMFMRIALKRGIVFHDRLVSHYRRHAGSAEMKKGARYWEGHFRILPKYLGINPAYDKLIWEKTGRDALDAWQEGHPGYTRLVWRSARKARRPLLVWKLLKAQLKRSIRKAKS